MLARSLILTLALATGLAVAARIAAAQGRAWTLDVLQWQQATLGWLAAHGGPALPGAALPK